MRDLRLSRKNGTFFSSGLEAINLECGGGLYSGTIVAYVEESCAPQCFTNIHSNEARTMSDLKFLAWVPRLFAIEGIDSKQRTFLYDSTSNPVELFHDPLKAPINSSVPENDVTRVDEGVRIAWRYSLPSKPETSLRKKHEKMGSKSLTHDRYIIAKIFDESENEQECASCTYKKIFDFVYRYTKVTSQNCPCRIILLLMGKERLDQSPDKYDMDDWSDTEDACLVKFLTALNGLIKYRRNALVLINLKGSALSDEIHDVLSRISDVHIQSRGIIQDASNISKTNAPTLGTLSINARLKQRNFACGAETIRQPNISQVRGDRGRITHWIRRKSGEMYTEKIGIQ